MTTRPTDQLRTISIERNYSSAAPGSVLVKAGNTIVLCTASVEDDVPRWLAGSGKGWITAEYSMLPGSTSPRKRRERSGKIDGRTSEIQRLIGRSYRAVANLEALGERLITVDCDVLQADGGTRTASITGGLVALVDAIRSIDELQGSDTFPLADSVAAVSVGIINGSAVLDLDYPLDSSAEVDMNVVMTGGGQYVEVQGTGEKSTFSEEQLASLLSHARTGIEQLTACQKEALGDAWPWE